MTLEEMAIDNPDLAFELAYNKGDLSLMYYRLFKYNP